ncbi:MAG: hypothetical protein HOP09_08995 [Hyphomicrobium sp.]|nr:hypothetical protein [Hyphomicrobium sp.]
MRFKFHRGIALTLAVAILAATSPSTAGESWQPFNPFADIERKKAAKRAPAPAAGAESRPYLSPMAGKDNAAGGSDQSAPPAPRDTPPRDTVMREALPPAVPAPVEKGDIAPVMAADGSGLPHELWRGLTAEALEKLISQLEIPPRSPALHGLWKRLITADVTAPAGATADGKFTALRLEVLYRSGLAADAAAEIAKQPPGASDALLTLLTARNELASGKAPRACEIVQAATSAKTGMPPRLKGQAILMSGYCAALANDAASAGLAAELAREQGEPPSPGLEALDAISIGSKPKIAVTKQLSLLDYRLVERAGGLPHKDVLQRGEPALLVALANDAATPVDLGLPAAEEAAKLNALAPDMLAAIYRANANPETADTLLAGGKLQGAFRRAALFKSAEAEQTPMKKTRLVRAFIDDAKRNGILFLALQMAAPVIAALNPQPEISWFAETGAEIGLASGQYDLARRWIATANVQGRPGGSLDHWLALADIADPNLTDRGQSLNALDTVAQSGRFRPDDLHRLATVLDALSYNVPIPLWEAASRTPQPTTGYLPETGVLSELQDAAKKKEFGRTVLLAMKSLGPNGAEGAHMIALGDSIRALKRAGLDADARRLGLEALLGAWPRSTAN